MKLLFSGAEPDVFSNARIYLIGSCTSYCGIAVEEGVCGALRGVGQTRSTLALSFIMNLSYVLLNVLFINVLHMGVLGMVISINISRYFAAGCALVYLSRWDNPVHFRFADVLHFNPAMLKKIFFIGIPFAAEQMFFNGGKILTQTFIVRLGTLALATNAICGSHHGLAADTEQRACHHGHHRGGPVHRQRQHTGRAQVHPLVPAAGVGFLRGDGGADPARPAADGLAFQPARLDRAEHRAHYMDHRGRADTALADQLPDALPRCAPPATPSSHPS